MPGLADGINATATNTEDLLDAVSAPIAALTHYSIDVPAGTDVQVIAANAARFKVSVNHAGEDDSGSLWLGFGQAGQPDVGEWLEPGGRWEEAQYLGSVHVYNDGSETVTVTGVEWGTA